VMSAGGLSRAEKAAVLGGNAARLLRIRLPKAAAAKPSRKSKRTGRSR